MDTMPQDTNITPPITPQTPVPQKSGGNTGTIITTIIILILLIAGGMYFYFAPLPITNGIDKSNSTETEDELLRKEFEASGDLNIEAEMQALDKEFE